MVNPRDLERLVEYPRENLDCELKEWLDVTDSRSAATLAKACLALANHGGGYLLVGFAEQAGAWAPVTIGAVDAYTQDLVNGIVSRYADPVFHVEVHHVTHPTTGSKHPVIVVPGGHPVPVRCRRACENVLSESAYYIRRPGPSSEPPRTAEEWDALIRRCVLHQREELVRRLSAALTPTAATAVEVVSGRHEAWIAESQRRFETVQLESCGSLDASPQRHGTWMAAISVEARESDLPMRTFRDRLRKCVGHETGWPIGVSLDNIEGKRPYVTSGVVEAWLGSSEADAGHSDFWRASPQGQFVTFRGYQDDDRVDARRLAGTCLDFTIFVWRVAEALLYAMRFANEFADADASVQVTMQWTGLKGRRLVNTASSDRYHLSDSYRCHDAEVSASIRIDNAGAIDVGLSELVGQLTRPLYDAFDFFELSTQIRDAELLRLRRRC